TLTTSALSVGTHTISVSYISDTNFKSSTSGTLVETMNQDATTVNLLTNLNPSHSGESVMFTASVCASAPGTGIPTGTVTFNDGGVSIGSGTLSIGNATCKTAGLSVGTHTITASYAGDANFTGSTSANLLQIVNQDGSFTTVTSSANPSVFGQSL